MSIMRLRFQRGERDELKTLHPGYFAMVMATGIVAIAAELHGLRMVAAVLLWLNGLFLAVLALATLARAVRYPQAFAADIESHSRGVGFFTSVAAAAVFGTQLAVAPGAATAAAAFLVITLVLWVVVTYGELAVLIAKPEKPSLAEGLNGTWLVSIVATQGVAILTVLVAAAGLLAGLRDPMLFMALAFWLGGGALYFLIMPLIFYRYMFVPMTAQDITPPYWIDMGAAAISTLAGALLAEHAALSPALGELTPFVRGFTLFFWAIASWWIPMLVVLATWRHLMGGVPLAYGPLCWGGVFPLGMYSVATYQLTHIVAAPFLLWLSQAFMIIALAAWSATFVGFLDTRLNLAPPAD